MSRPVTIKAQTLTSLQTLAGTGVDLGDGYKKVFVQLATATSGSHYFQFAPDENSAYHRVAGGQSTANVAAHFAADSSISNCIVEVPPACGRFAKIENTSGTTNTHTYYKWIVTY